MRSPTSVVIVLFIAFSLGILWVIGYISFQGLNEMVDVLLESLKGTELTALEAMFGILDTFLVLSLLVSGVLIAISQLVDRIRDRPRNRFKDWLELAGVNGLAVLIFALSSTIVRGASLVALGG